MKKVFSFSTLLLFLMVASAWATSITYELGGVFSGTSPTGTPPTATFDDNNTPGSVDLTIKNGLTGTEFLSQFYFNFDGDPSQLSFPTTPASPIYSISSKSNAYKADGDGYFDVLIEFYNNNNDPSNNARFGAGDSVTISMTDSGIVANDFNLLSFGGGNSKDGLYVAAHVQNIPPNGDSGWITDGGGGGGGFIPIPEPATLLLIGLGLLGTAGIARRKALTK